MGENIWHIVEVIISFWEQKKCITGYILHTSVKYGTYVFTWDLNNFWIIGHKLKETVPSLLFSRDYTHLNFYICYTILHISMIECKMQIYPL